MTVVIPGMLEQVAMQLKNKSGAKLHLKSVRVNCLQDVAVACDFLLRSILWERLVFNERLDALNRSSHSLDAIARFRALDDRSFPEGFEQLG